MYKPEVQLNSGFTTLWTIVVRREIYSVHSQVYFTQNMFLVTTTYLRRVFTHVCIQIIELRYECAQLKTFSYITIGYGLYVNVALIFLSPLDPVYSISKESLRHIVNKNINMLKRAFLGVVKYNTIMCARAVFCLLPCCFTTYMRSFTLVSVSTSHQNQVLFKHKSFIVYVSIMLTNQYRLQGDIFFI